MEAKDYSSLPSQSPHSSCTSSQSPQPFLTHSSLRTPPLTLADPLTLTHSPSPSAPLVHSPSISSPYLLTQTLPPPTLGIGLGSCSPNLKVSEMPSSPSRWNDCGETIRGTPSDGEFLLHDCYSFDILGDQASFSGVLNDPDQKGKPVGLGIPTWDPKSGSSVPSFKGTSYRDRRRFTAALLSSVDFDSDQGSYSPHISDKTGGTPVGIPQCTDSPISSHRVRSGSDLSALQLGVASTDLIGDQASFSGQLNVPNPNGKPIGLPFGNDEDVTPVTYASRSISPKDPRKRFTMVLLSTTDFEGDQGSYSADIALGKGGAPMGIPGWKDDGPSSLTMAHVGDLSTNISKMEIG